ncbi:MAG: GNAT family N-acetyltransferase [Actinocrinis sp.]
MLRPLYPWQAEEFLEHMGRARATVDPWIPWAQVSSNLASARKTLQRYADNQAKDQAYLYGIWLRGRLVGGVMFVHFDAESGVCEIGCWLEESAVGRGLVTIAARHLVTWAFAEREMTRIEWRTSPANTRSSNVARRLGMNLDGVLRKSWLHNGEYHDTEVWSLLADEWRPAEAATA